MKRILLAAASVVTIGLCLLLMTPSWPQAYATTNAQIYFDSFTAIYHLSRDSRGLSLLTTEETIVADFSNSGSFYGITRQLPRSYQNHSVDIKVLNVSDAAGKPIPYRTTTDQNGNLIVTTGDPTIILYGSQTIKINYQTSGVINLKQTSNELLLDVNGRGWNNTFNRLNATIYIPTIFQASLQADPTCYVALNDTKNNNCQIKTNKTNDNTVITIKTGSVVAHQALVAKLNFAPSTFTNNHKRNVTWSVALVILTAAAVIAYRLNRRSSNKDHDHP